MLNEKKLDVEYGEIPKLWLGSQADVQRLIDYARKDAELPLRLLLEKELLGKFFEVCKISGTLLQDSFGGQSSRIEVMLLHEFQSTNHVMPAKPDKRQLAQRMKERKKKELKGAAVLEPEKGLHAEGCTLVLDFKSLYPSIMRTYNISPDTLIVEDGHEGDCTISPTESRYVKSSLYTGILPRVLTKLIEARARVKKQMLAASSEQKKILNAKQLALKDIANSIYGYTGYVKARLYMLDVANTITAYGRENIEKTKGLVEDLHGNHRGAFDRRHV
jgi:DNA polymerase I